MAQVTSAGLVLDSGTLSEILRRMAAALRQNSEEIRLLDAAIGDGDLGVTVELMAEAMRQFADSTEETDIGKLLAQCGIAINRANPSTFGTLMAAGFMGAGKTVTGKTTIDLADLVTMGRASIESIMARGKASVGYKTMLDALVPAVDALAEGQTKDEPLPVAVRAAALACERGMKATAEMVAMCGKARVFREKSIGVQDGGATVVHHMIDASAEYIDGLG